LYASPSPILLHLPSFLHALSPFTDVSRPDKISGAEIQAICQEAGMQAVRRNRYVILPKDFEKGYKSVVKGTETDYMFYG